MRDRQFTLGMGVALLMLTMLFIPTALAGTVAMTVTATLSTSTTETVTTDMDFGTIDLDPSGDTVRLDASAGAASPAVVTGNGSIITGGTSGLITINSQIAMTVDVTYPADGVVTLDDGAGHTLPLTDIDTYSEGGVTNGSEATVGGGIPLEIDVGGELIIPAAQPDGTYTTSMNVIISYS